MNREQKAATIDALVEQLSAAEAIIAVDYRGLKVSDAGQLRDKLRDSGASFHVVKNSLTERAAAQAGVEGLEPMLKGPTALTFVQGDPALAAKLLAETARAIHLLPFKGGIVSGHPLDSEQLVALSKLPSREVLYGQLVGVVASPLSGLVRTLGALLGGLAVALGQVRDQRADEQPAEAATPAEQPALDVEQPAEQVTSDGEQPAAASDEQGSPEAEPQEAAEQPAAEPAADTDQAEPAAEAGAEQQTATSEEN